MTTEPQHLDISRAFDPPYISAEIAPLDAQFKLTPEDFRVTELPLYESEGDGPHIYLTLTRSGQTTRQISQSLARLLSLKEVDIGSAGLKDKQALVTQTFSLHMPNAKPDDVARRVAEELSLTVDAVDRHRNKLRRGHLRGNRFEIRLRCSDPAEGLQRATQVVERLQQQGMPNFYGVQRFGLDLRNPERGLALIRRGRGARGWKDRLLCNSVQSALFNIWLADRIDGGLFERIQLGDIAKKTDSGGLFEVTDSDDATRRFASGAISYTGPIFGGKMREAAGVPGEVESALLDRSGLDRKKLGRARLDGSRRDARVRLEQVEIKPLESGIELQVVLPKGSYATILLREILKPDDPQLLHGSSTAG